MKAIFWSITYTNTRTGLRGIYMNIGFESKESAQAELGRIKREREKHKKNGLTANFEKMEESGLIIPSLLLGINWRIKKRYGTKANTGITN